MDAFGVIAMERRSKNNRLYRDDKGKILLALAHIRRFCIYTTFISLLYIQKVDCSYIECNIVVLSKMILIITCP